MNNLPKHVSGPTSNTLHYLATPVSHPDINVVELRYYDNLVACDTLRRSGVFTYSPMVHHYRLKTMYDWPNDWSFWKDRSLWMVERCDVLIILQLDGWQESIGMKAEINRAILKCKPIMTMADPKAPLQLAKVEMLKFYLNSLHGKSVQVAAS